jgi:SAM-dependent methyltransferase
VQLILTLGETPLANSLLREHELSKPEPRYPLDLVFCENCTLVQITEVIAPEVLFTDYPYFSSFSDSMLNHSKDLALRLIMERSLNSESLVVEPASNDGYLLRNYVEQGIPVLGIEPALNIAKFANNHGIRTLPKFFSVDFSHKLTELGYHADIIHANNVLAHIADINGFVSGIEHLLKPNGICVVEVPYVVDLVDHTEFDTIYHEHLYYYSLSSLISLFSRNGLTVYDVERIPIHGGSLRVFVGKNYSPTSTVDQMLETEQTRQADRFVYYEDFRSKVEGIRQDLVDLLEKLTAQDKRIAAYGASAKGSTLLNYTGIGARTIEFVADRSTVKQGYYTPGTHIPIVAPGVLLKEMPDYVLLLVWNFAEEILAQQEQYVKAGGKFIIPIPEVRIL